MVVSRCRLENGGCVRRWLHGLRNLEVVITALLCVVVLAGCGAGDGTREPAAGEGEIASVGEALGASPDTGCTGLTYKGHDYWFCPTLRSWSSARAKCEAAGYNLVRVEDAAENDFVKSHLGLDSWIGANDTATEGTWVWTFGGSKFWTGTASGSPFGGLFSKWHSAQPDNLHDQDCGKVMLDGTWSDEACSLSLPFACESGADQCPSDPQKVIPGLCGCGVSDIDSDGDGTPDCQDQCPSDPTKIRPGDCGCSNAPKATGTACQDGLCTTNNACNGAGVCGNPASCAAPDSSCTYGVFQNTYYWFCGHDRAFTDARQHCQTVGMDLSAVESGAEDKFIAVKASALDHVFLGATDEVTKGTWVWKSTGQQFWSGGTAGSATAGAYANWESGQPNSSGSQDCIAKDPASAGAQWEGHSCSQPTDYVCERIDLCPGDPNKRDPGQCGCGVPDTDTDGDHVADCVDACPNDGNKTAAGVCGCGVSEADPDADGIPTCIDFCPSDSAKSEPGQCGCAGAGAAPANTPCSDGICAGVAGKEFTCNGAGQCGDPDACSPDPGHCTAKVFGENIYWICTGPVTWAQANAKCSAVSGQSLVEVDSRQENAFLAHVIPGQAWTGANDQGAAGTWRWTVGSSPSGNAFFSAGAAANGSFINWASGKPADNSGQCGSFSSDGSGKWIDQSCAASLAYVCKRPNLPYAGPTSPPIPCSDFWPGQTCAPAPTSCVASDPSLPATKEDFKAQVDACRAGCTADGDPGCATACTGAAIVPPPGSTCSPEPAAQCEVTNPGQDCVTSADCPAGQTCGVVFCGGCSLATGTSCNIACSGARKCGAPVGGCELGNDPNTRCEEVTLCAPPGSAGDSDPRNDPTSDLTPKAFDPNSFGQPTPPVTNYPADLPCGLAATCNLGAANGWCTYLTPAPLPHKAASDSKPGHAGKGGIVHFDFDPNLTLNFDATPLALGETRLDLLAEASLSAGASFDFPVVGHAGFTIFDADLALKANRCRAWTSDSKLQVFGADFLPSGLSFDTNPSILKFADCDAAIDSFEKMVDRAKKSLKDAQELLTQYKQLKTGGSALAAHLCQQIASDPPFGFPPGDCSTESAEATINRFIEFYSLQVRQAVSQQLTLATQVLHAELPPLSLGDDDHEEDQLLFNTTIPVGPIPVNLSVQSVEHYGFGGDLHFAFNPGALLTSGTKEEMAHVWGDVHPFANAGVSLFIGVGFDIGVASASAGIEGTIVLGNITAPLVAGAGLDIQPEPDTRPLPVELASIAGSTPIVTPTQFKFSMKYDYGAEIDMNKILSGYLAARVHVSFLFFSKTWRAKIIDFGNGFSLPPLVLLKGQSGDVALGDFPWATVQMPTPFISLAELPVPSVPQTLPGVPFDTSHVEKLFYDSLCTCDAPGASCFRSADCCASAPICFHDPIDPTQAKACSECRQEGQRCNTVAECCSQAGAGCYPQTDGDSIQVCTSCLQENRLCDPNHNLCCNGCSQDLNGVFRCGPPPPR